MSHYVQIGGKREKERERGQEEKGPSGSQMSERNEFKHGREDFFKAWVHLFKRRRV